MRWLLLGVVVLASACDGGDESVETLGIAGRGSGGAAGKSATGGAAGTTGPAGRGGAAGGSGSASGGSAGAGGAGGDEDKEPITGAGGNDDGGAGGGAGSSVAGAAGASAAGGGGDAGAAGAAGGAGGGTAGSAGTGTAGAGGTPGADGVPTSQRFDLDDPSDRLFWKKGLHDPHHIMQSFTVDQQNGRMYFAQLKDGGSGDDLCITETDMAGNETGHMYHDNAGHGVSIGVEAVGKDSYLWVETDSHKNDDDGRGTALLRFKFVDGKKPAGQKLLAGSSTITAATDPINKRIVIRRREGGKFVYRLFPLADAAKGDFAKPLEVFQEPTLGSGGVTFQGYTIFGQYLYTLDGTGHDDAKDINSHVTRIDMRTGKAQDRKLTKAGESLIFREPEGMAVYRTGSGETRLCIGLGSHNKVNGPDRWANVYFKNELVP